MTDYISRAITNILAILRVNVEDPIHRTRGGNWIYYGAYRETDNIGVYFIWDKEFPGDMHLGSVVQPHNIVLRMYVLVRAGAKGTISSVEYTGPALMNRIHDNITNVLKANSTSITGVNSITRAPTNRGAFDYDPESKMHFTRTYFNVFIWRTE